MEQKELLNIVAQFDVRGKVKDVKPLGNGLINTTYKVTTEGDAPDYVLQHINHNIFPDVDMLMDNIIHVTNHIRKKLEADHTEDIERKCLRFIPAKDGKYYYFDGEKYWRIMVYIPDTVSMTAVTPETSVIVGETFGQFQSWLADIPVQLGETIKNFHNLEFRLQQLEKAAEENRSGRVENVRDLIESIKARSEEMTKAERLHREGKLPKRICHCDTKVDNILFDKDGKVLCVIDLDTVMPNYIFSDFGDYLRSAANTGLEDDPNLDNVNFNIDIFKAFTKGYLHSAGVFLTPIEIENLPYAAKLFPYMQSTRFLIDYINGDVYYKTQYAEHNQVRARAQWKLFESADQREMEMEIFIKQVVGQRGPAGQYNNLLNTFEA